MDRLIFGVRICALALLVSCSGTHTKDLLEANFLEREAPQILSAVGKSEFEIEINFSEPILTEPASTIANYTITPNLVIQSIAISASRQQIYLRTAVQTSGASYEITLNGFFDLFGNPLRQNKTQFTGFVSTLTTPPFMQAPVNKAILSGSYVDFEWGGKDKATTYTLEIFSDSAMTQQVGSTISISAPTTTYRMNSVSPITYWWRLRADTTEAGQYSTGSFDVLDSSTIYVFCPASASSCVDTGWAGNRTHPLRTLTGAIIQASNLGISQIKVAARGSGAKYNENVNLVGTPLQISGGYYCDTNTVCDFNTVDTVANETMISSTMGSTFQITGLNSGTSIIENLTIYGGTTATAYAMYINGSTSSLTVRYCKLLGGNTQIDSFALYIGDSGSTAGTGPMITQNQIISGNVTASASTYGIYVLRGAPVISNNVLVKSGTAVTGTSNAIYLDQSSATVSNHATGTLVSGDITGNGTTRAIYLGNNNSDSLVSSNDIKGGNVITAGSTGASSGIEVSSTAQLIQNNTVTGGTIRKGSSHGIYIYSYSGSTLSNNTIKSGDALENGGDTWGIRGGYGFPVTIRGNTITAGNAVGGNTVGTYAGYNANCQIHGNLITAGNTTGAGDSTGVIANGTCTFTNNIIRAGTAGTGRSLGMDYSGGAVTFTNNVLASDSSSGASRVITIGAATSSSMKLTNNVFHCRGATGTRQGIFEESTGTAGPGSMHNNMVFGCATGFYYDADTATNVTTIGNFNTASMTTGGTAPSVSGNITIVDYASGGFGGTSGYELTASTPTSISQGGLTTSGNNCGPALNTACGSVTTDYKGITRTVAYSIGPYEY